MPEKHRVFGGQDGKTLDLEASARKVAEAYGHLERRFGAGDTPPKSAEEYKVNVPDALKDAIKVEELAGTKDFKDFLGKLHAAGASQKIVDVAVAELLEGAVKLQQVGPVMQQTECEAELRQQDGWKSDTEYGQRISTAFRAGKAIFGKDFDSLVKDYGNDPRFIRGMESIGREMNEDLPPSPEAQAQLQENLDALMNSPAFLNASDPQHMAVRAKVDALTARLVGTKPVAGGRTHSFKTA